MERAELHRQLLGLAHIIRVDLKDKLFAYQINEDALALAQLMDGKLLLVANVSDLDSPTDSRLLQVTGGH